MFINIDVIDSTRQDSISNVYKQFLRVSKVDWRLLAQRLAKHYGIIKIGYDTQSF